MSNLVPDGASPVRTRTKDITDRKTGAVIGSQTQRVYLLATIANGRLVLGDRTQFEFNEEANYDGNVVPAHHKGRYRTVDVFLQAGIKPAAELVGRVEVKAFVTSNTYTAKATGEEEIREDSENDYLRITFTGPADESEPQKVIEVGRRLLEDGTYEDGFGWTKQSVCVFIGVKPKEKMQATEPFNPPRVVEPTPTAPAPDTTPAA